MTPDPAPYGADLPIIARLRDEQVEFWYGGEATVGPLLAALDAANAEVLRLREVLREITEDPTGAPGAGASTCTKRGTSPAQPSSPSPPRRLAVGERTDRAAVLEDIVRRHARHTDRMCHSWMGGPEHPPDRCMCGLDEALVLAGMSPTDVRGPGAARRGGYGTDPYPHRSRSLVTEGDG